MAATDDTGGARPGALARWGGAHARDFVGSLGRLLEAPFATLLTALVIGVTLALPTALHLTIKNINELSYGWERAVRASLFLRDAVDEARGRELTAEIGARAGVTSAEYLSREQALAEFRARSGFSEALDLAGGNPLPAVIVISPDASHPRAEIDALLREWAARPEVELAKLDQQWLERLYTILEIVRRGVMMFSILLGFAVVVTIGNTVRLDIEARRAEIVVLKLIGATDRFVQRPFLYTGLWYGLLGSFFALLLLNLGLAALSGPVGKLIRLYDAPLTLAGPSPEAVLTVIGTGLALGWLGALWTVRRHLDAVRPV